jgi:hypothetical protein
VPADEDESPKSELIAIDQRVAILKAVFVEVNGSETDKFLDEGLCRYDRAAEMAKKMLLEVASPTNSE